MNVFPNFFSPPELSLPLSLNVDQEPWSRDDRVVLYNGSLELVAILYDPSLLTDEQRHGAKNEAARAAYRAKAVANGRALCLAANGPLLDQMTRAALSPDTPQDEADAASAGVVDYLEERGVAASGMFRSDR